MLFEDVLEASGVESPGLTFVGDWLNLSSVFGHRVGFAGAAWLAAAIWSSAPPDGRDVERGES